MPRTITILAAFYWMALFAMLAIVAAGASHVDAIVAMVDPFGAVAGPARVAPEGHAAVTTAFALGFALVATLFLWAFLTVPFEAVPGDSDFVLRAAIAGGAAMLALLMLAEAPDPVRGMLPALSIQLAALMATYAAALAERRSAETPATHDTMDEVRAAARLMAQGAAHTSMLGRFSARPDQSEREREPA